jgi:predicted amidohydrolase
VPLAALAALAACGPADDDETGPPPACDHQVRPARALRVFAVGHKLEVSEGATYASYAGAFRSTVEREVIPNLATDRPNVLVFPESVAFTAAFVGARGDEARSKDSAFLAYVALQDQMRGAFDHYRRLAPDGGIGRWILLAATDPTWRAFDQTFSAIARDLGVYVVASVDVGDVRPVADAGLAQLLGDPERGAGATVVEVPDGKVYNQAVLYGPDGAQLGRARKVYLTDGEHGDLGMTGHLPEHVMLSVDELVHAAALISRDAWMPDLQERAALAGTELVLQHEAFSTWTVPEPGAPWPADNLKRSGWAAVQKHPELRMTVAPMLAGNFFDVGFDGQTFIATQGTPAMERRALLAQDPDTGWAAIAPWVAADSEDGSLEERRARLRAIGEQLLPGGSRAGEHVAGTTWADLEIPADDGYPVAAGADPAASGFGPSIAVAPSGLGRQRSASPIVLADGGLVVAWEDTRFCTGQILVARSDDGGVTFSPPVRIAPWNRPQHSPSLIALDATTLVVAWQEVLGDGRAEIRVATSRDRGDTWSHRVRVDPEASRDAHVPSLATAGGVLHLAFVDSRDGNRRVHYTRSRDAGRSWRPAVRIDPRERDPNAPDDTLSNEWSPRVAASGERVVIAYTHRERPDPAEQPSWDVHVVESADGGERFAPPRRIDPGGFPERIAADPVIALDAAGWQLAFSTYRGTAPTSLLALVHSAAPAELNFGVAPRDAWWPTLAAHPGGGFVLAWQDFRSGGNDIYLARAGDAGLRVDDAGDPEAQAWRPRLAVAPDGTIYVIWEDSREGRAELRVARGSLP